MSLFNRYMYNMKIIKDLTALIFKNPDLRFVQILYLAKIIENNPKDGCIKDKFYEESYDTYINMRK